MITLELLVIVILSCLLIFAIYKSIQQRAEFDEIVKETRDIFYNKSSNYQQQIDDLNVKLRNKENQLIVCNKGEFSNL